MYVDKNLVIKSWDSIQKYYDELAERMIRTQEDLIKWWKDRSELESVLEEDMAWRYIKMNADTANKALAEDFNFFVTEIEPNISIWTNKLDHKLVQSEFSGELEQGKYFVPIRSIRRSIDLFREENVPVFAEMQQKEQEYGQISSRMTVEMEGKTLTLQQASNYLKNLSRDIRELAYRKIQERKLDDSAALDELFDQLLELRNTVAINAGFSNFRDYKFEDMGRFDYSVQDCFDFHDAIKESFVPLLEKLHLNRKQKLGFEVLKPWDLDVDVQGKEPLKPFEESEQLIQRAISCFNRVRPSYGSYLKTMKEGGFLDLESRIGKAPGGFNYPLYESNIPFIYMNATGNNRDLVTMMHEGGHAIHSFLCANHEIVNFKSTPSEVAELASMSMELISMEHWDEFYSDPEELKRAKINQLEGIIKIMPWVATVDKFQHWIYTNKGHTLEERAAAWTKILDEFSSGVVDSDEFENYRKHSWKGQLHIFEVPFYYIEYAMSQLGAVAIWRNFRRNPAEALDNYEKALKLGYTVPVPEIYKTAGIKFDFSSEYVNELAVFVEQELEKLGI